ncbi:hypothetical protein NDU88_000196 [Pleurodeles waltl]|uniref:Uncharacterized protein n=1 Tax=Pleurodeles waltl TaxID=8319 RepID=A0AAV7LTX0_PLEWA|nr:hypothetical protein NDU88_000196 [Pleurodeles waltl]
MVSIRFGLCLAVDHAAGQQTTPAGEGTSFTEDPSVGESQQCLVVPLCLSSPFPLGLTITRVRVRTSISEMSCGDQEAPKEYPVLSLGGCCLLSLGSEVTDSGGGRMIVQGQKPFDLH